MAENKSNEGDTQRTPRSARGRRNKPASEGGEFAPGIHSVLVDPRDPDRVLVAVSTAGVLETRDGGQSWRSRNKGLVMDVWLLGGYRYMISPMVIGIFEFTMMRTKGELNHKEWAKLFCEYLDDGKFYYKNLKGNQKYSILRTLPHEETIDESDH